MKALSKLILPIFISPISETPARLFFDFLCDKVDEAKKVTGDDVVSKLGKLAAFRGKVAEYLPAMEIFLDYTQNATKKTEELWSAIDACLRDTQKIGGRVAQP